MWYNAQSKDIFINPFLEQLRQNYAKIRIFLLKTMQKETDPRHHRIYKL